MGKQTKRSGRAQPPVYLQWLNQALNGLSEMLVERLAAKALALLTLAVIGLAALVGLEPGEGAQLVLAIILLWGALLARVVVEQLVLLTRRDDTSEQAVLPGRLEDYLAGAGLLIGIASALLLLGVFWP